MAGSPTISPALILGGIRYGETSRIIRLITPDFGVVSAIARGAMRPGSRFGASLRLLSQGDAHLTWARHSDLHYLNAFDVQETHQGLSTNLNSYLTASAMAELAVHFVPADANPYIYGLMRQAIDTLEQAGAEDTGIVGLRLLWQLVAALGVPPELKHCVVDGREVGPGEDVTLLLPEGGVLCNECSRQDPGGVRLSRSDYDDLLSLMEPAARLPQMDHRHLAAHRRLLLRWVGFHLGHEELPALTLWQQGVKT